MITVSVFFSIHIYQSDAVMFESQMKFNICVIKWQLTCESHSPLVPKCSSVETLKGVVVL